MAHTRGVATGRTCCEGPHRAGKASVRAPRGFRGRRIDWRSLLRDRTTDSASTVRIWYKLEDTGAADVRRSDGAVMGCVAVASFSRFPLKFPKSRAWLSRYESRHSRLARTQAVAMGRAPYESARRAGESLAPATLGFRGRCVDRHCSFPDQTTSSASALRIYKKVDEKVEVTELRTPADPCGNDRGHSAEEHHSHFSGNECCIALYLYASAHM